jgi:hypothetical protein
MLPTIREPFLIPLGPFPSVPAWPCQGWPSEATGPALAPPPCCLSAWQGLCHLPPVPGLRDPPRHVHLGHFASAPALWLSVRPPLHMASLLDSFWGKWFQLFSLLSFSRAVSFSQVPICHACSRPLSRACHDSLVLSCPSSALEPLGTLQQDNLCPASILFSGPRFTVSALKSLFHPLPQPQSGKVLERHST